MFFCKNCRTHSNIDVESIEQEDTQLSESGQYNDESSENVSGELHSPVIEYELQPRTPLSTVSSVCSSEKTESRTVQNKRKIPKSQEEPEAMHKFFREFLDKKKTKRTERTAKAQQADPVEEFFICMSKTVKTFPPLWQSKVKRKVFDIVNSIEVMLLSGNNTVLTSTSSSGLTYPQNTSQCASLQGTLPSTLLQPIFYDIPPAQTDISTNMQESHTSAPYPILN